MILHLVQIKLAHLLHSQTSTLPKKDQCYLIVQIIFPLFKQILIERKLEPSLATLNQKPSLLQRNLPQLKRLFNMNIGEMLWDMNTWPYKGTAPGHEYPYLQTDNLYE